MISRATIFWLIALAGMVLMTVTVSLKVDRVNNRIDAIAARKASVQERITLLDASYQLLISPDRLRPLADRHLALQEVRGDQLIPLASLPARIPLPTARRPEPEPKQYGQRQEPPQLAEPPHMPTLPPILPEDMPHTPPWLEAHGRPALQPVTLLTPQRIPQ
jgi:hypothetical protein